MINEEIDALRTLGISPMEFLVLPRMIALILMTPLLAIYANLMGILGGAFVSAQSRVAKQLGREIGASIKAQHN